MDLISQEYELRGLGQINVILGKNGCGKSTLLKYLDSAALGDDVGKRKYVTPERGGFLVYDPGIENSITNNPNWVADTRRVNQLSQFKQQSVVQFRQLELTVHREAEMRNQPARFQGIVDSLNELLDNIEIRRSDQSFRIYDRSRGQEVSPNVISSGESELIALGIELLMFSQNLMSGKTNLLLLDEPDVHLHPDLQGRLMKFLSDTVIDTEICVIIATHSTAILGGLEEYSNGNVAFMKSGENRLDFQEIDEVHRQILPVFGAHPLSNIFNEKPILLLEGEDDVRIWQKAVATSMQRIRVYPVSCGSVFALSEYESSVNHLISCVYENGTAFSLRDGDGNDNRDELDDLEVLQRLRLKCRASENLMLTDECLSAAGLTFSVLQSRIDDWIAVNMNHPKYEEMIAFRDSGFNRKDHDLKEIRMILIGQILDVTKPWEVLLGQVLGKYRVPEAGIPQSEGTMAHFLGEKILNNLFA